MQETVISTDTQSTKTHKRLISLFFSYTCKLHKDINKIIELKGHDSAQNLGAKLESEWKKQRYEKTPSLTKAIIKTFGGQMISCSLVCCLIEALIISESIALNYLLMYIGDEDKWIVYICGGCMLGGGLLYAIFYHMCLVQIQFLFLKFRTACGWIIYKKALKLRQYENLDLMELMDQIHRVSDKPDMQFIHFPVVVFCLLGLLGWGYWAIGYTILISGGMMILSIPLQIYIAEQFAKVRARAMDKSNQRVNKMEEIIEGIEEIKMLAWEDFFINQINKLRKEETHDIRYACTFRIAFITIKQFISRFAIFIGIMQGYLIGIELTPNFVYTLVMSSIFMKHIILDVLPNAIFNFTEMNHLVGRMKIFLLKEEVMNESQILGKKGIWVLNASSQWMEELSVINLDFNLEENESAVLVGEFGSGKNIFTKMLLKEIPLKNGVCIVAGIVSYSPRDPCLFPGTIRENILFGSKFNRSKYRKITEICCLKKDFITFPFGDLTPIGDLFSKSQKSKISLARALYKDADIYIIESIHERGREILKNCVHYLKGKCVIYTTEILTNDFCEATKILLMRRGKIVEEADFNFFQSNFPNLFSPVKIAFENSRLVSRGLLFRLPSTPSLPRKDLTKKSSQINLTYNFLWVYFLSGGCFIINFTLIFFLITQISLSLFDFYLNNLLQFNKMDYFIAIDILMGIIFILLLIRCILAIVFFESASAKMHNNMLLSVMHAPFKFFIFTNTKEILAKFSKHILVLDYFFPQTVGYCLQHLLVLLGAMILIAILEPYFVIGLITMLILGYLLVRNYINGYTQLSKLENTTRKAVLEHVTNTLSGISVIRAFQSQEYSIAQYSHYTNMHGGVVQLFFSSQKGLDFWVEITCWFYFAAVIIIFVFIRHYNPFVVGLAITQAIFLPLRYQLTIQEWVRLRLFLDSIKKSREYIALEPEPSGKQIPPFWPSTGKIQFQNVSLEGKYDKFLLRNISFEIEDKECIGIVGETSSGKTSLIKSLFHLLPTTGNILIDGVDIKTIPLKLLRSCISIIPQFPIIFNGMLRENLDPFREYPDFKIWYGLRDVDLLDKIFQLPDGLYCPVSNNANFFGLTHKRLLHVVISILKRNKILILDDAGDLEVDTNLHAMIRRIFANTTMIIISCNPGVLLACDKILVMEDGKLVEFDKPEVLLENTASVFSRLINFRMDRRNTNYGERSQESSVIEY